MKPKDALQRNLKDKTARRLACINRNCAANEARSCHMMRNEIREEAE